MAAGFSWFFEGNFTQIQAQKKGLRKLNLYIIKHIKWL
jgi:hypothetical protein